MIFLLKEFFTLSEHNIFAALADGTTINLLGGTVYFTAVTKYSCCYFSLLKFIL